jgi:DNA-directed RNA polymerase subunit RPC12/RpoP
MQTVQFQCGHCGKLMGVGSEYLGQQVRCPHCQQVVVAPPANPPAFEPPPGLTETIVPPPAGEHEDIFAPPEATDDLFGRSETPRIEMPSPSENAFPPSMEPALSATMPYVPPEVVAPFGPSDGKPAAIPSWMSESVAEPPPAVEMPPTIDMPPPVVEMPPTIASPAVGFRAPRRTEPKAPWFLLLVFSPLLLYSIVITVFAVLLYRQQQDVEEQRRNPFKMMPDEGDKPGVQKAKQLSLWNYDPKLPTLPLPDSLCTWLDKHEPLRIGDVQITPKRIERKRVRVVVQGSNPEQCQGDSLVLYLDVKNLSSQYAFAPLDNYFDRSWRSGARPPLTLLEIGDKYRCYGGPAEWHRRGDTKNRRQWIEGRKDEPDVLQPGEQKEMFVCTNGDDAKAVALLFGGNGRPPYRGTFLWRVRLRRGLVHLEDKDYSATAVLGVRFRDGDIEKQDALGLGSRLIRPNGHRF